MRQIQRSPLQKIPDGKKIPPELCVEDIQVYADRKYMYCKGIVRSHGSRARSNLVEAYKLWPVPAQQQIDSLHTHHDFLILV